MQPLFWLELPGDVPLPCLDTEPDGTPRSPDGVHYFDLDGMAANSRFSRETLRRSFDGFMREQMSIKDTETPEVDEPKQRSDELTFVPIDEESIRTDLKIDIAGLSADVVRDRVRQRMAGITPEHYIEFETQMKEMGYDILRRECYPIVQWNDDLKKNEVFCCATLGAVEAKMMASNLCDGWVGTTLYAGADGELKPIWIDPEPPQFVQVTLRRRGVAEPCIILVDWNEAAQYKLDATGKKRTRNLTQLWRERPKIAMERCAKMKAMRTLFRDFVGTVYAREELPELSARHLAAMPEKSTTLSGIRNRSWLPSRVEVQGAGSEIRGGGTQTLELDVISNEVDARIAMRSRGLVQDFMIDRVIAQARKDFGEVEELDPEGFWSRTMDVASRRFGMRA